MLRLGQLKTIASVSHYQVVGPSLTHESSYGAVGDVSPYFDAANLHNYLAGRHPGTTGWGANGYGSIDWNLRVISPYSGGKPIVTTETGYQDGPGIPDRVTPEVGGRYLPRLLIEQFRAGIARTFLYELYDFPDSGSYGLIHADGAPKPAFNAVKALLHLLADPGPADHAAAAGLRHHPRRRRRPPRRVPEARWSLSGGVLARGAELRRAGPA